MSPDRPSVCPSPVALEIGRDSDLWNALPEAEAVASAAVRAAFAEAALQALPEAELALTLADDERVRALNAEWRGQDKPTNVLTFPAVEPGETADAAMLGDVILAFESVSREAAEQDKSLADHFAHLVVHGVLHLFGHDHLEESEAEAMEAIETRALARIGVADPYASLVHETAD